MVRSMWLPVTSGVASVCVGLALWPSLASPADGLSLFSAAVADAKTPFDALFQRLPLLGRSSSASSSSGWSLPAEHQDLRVANVSIHRVRYERGEKEGTSTTSVNTESETADEFIEAEETLVRSLFGSAWAAATRKARFGSGGSRAPATSVVVTWEDHPLAVLTRPDAEAMCSTAEGECVPLEEDEQAQRNEATETKLSGRTVVYEVQVWVNGWGLDAFWHPANRKLTTRDPFVVVHGLPHEQEELGVRVRMKVQTRARLLAGLSFMTSEADGPWSDVVTLSPASEPALETLVAFFASHQLLGGMLVLLVALSALVILRLVYQGRRRPQKSELLLVSSSSIQEDEDEDPAEADETSSSPGGGGTASVRLRRHYQHQHRHHQHQPKRHRVASLDLEQEVADLRQELADSEAEVRQLMLFRGYGIDELREDELQRLESELRRTLQLVQKRRRVKHFESPDETEEEEEEEEEDDEDELDAVDLKRPDLQYGALGTVFEEDTA